MMRNTRLKKWTALIVAVCSALAFVACDGGKIPQRPVVDDGTTKEFLRDLNFSRGISVSPFIANTSKNEPWGTLDYGGQSAGDAPIWTMAQWGCTHDMRSDYTFTQTESVMTYTDGGKFLQVNTDKNKAGVMTLGIKGSEEYTRDEDGNIRERTQLSENWPHILMSQNVNQTIDMKADALFMEVTYEVTECTSLVDRTLYPLDENLNAAQFQWFVTLYDNNEESETYNHGMWFGFSMFDTRALGGTPSGHAAYDGGKEDSTGAYIYMFSLAQATTLPDCVVDSLPSSVIGKEVHLKIDVLPFLKTALKMARQAGALMGASVDKLRIGSTNIGWELPGNYDASVEISYLNMYHTY